MSRATPDRCCYTLLFPILLSSLLVAGCTLPWARNGDSAAEFARKPVMDKVEPNYLIAVDQTQCVVDRERFAKVRVGDRVWCMWRRSRGPEERIS